VLGTGDQVRCFCHVADVIPALIALAEVEPACGRAVNLGGCEQVSISELAQRVIAATGSRSTIVYRRGPAAYEDVPRRVPDCTLARALVGFRATRTLDDIIGSLIEDQREARAATR
jgi:nucleoside-diphosphate-sugar epimerase